MSKKTNGTGNGHDKSDDKIISFPTRTDRKRARKDKERQEKEWRAAYKKEQKPTQPPFLNLEKITPFIRFLILGFLAVHLPLYLLLDPAQKLKTFYLLGFVPGAFTGTFDFHWYMPLTLLTHMFIHGGWMHLVFNLVMAMALGILFEREYGARRAAIFFFACGVAGAAVYFLLNPFSTMPVIGASGGISGFFGAALILLHQRKQFGTINTKLRDYGPWKMIGLWAILMIVIGLLSGPNMAWQAHLGGFLTGAALLRGLQKGIVRF